MVEWGVEEDVAVGLVRCEHIERGVACADHGDEAGHDGRAVEVCEPAASAEGFQLLDDDWQSGCPVGFHINEEGEGCGRGGVEDSVDGGRHVLGEGSRRILV